MKFSSAAGSIARIEAVLAPLLGVVPRANAASWLADRPARAGFAFTPARRVSTFLEMAKVRHFSGFFFNIPMIYEHIRGTFQCGMALRSGRTEG